MKTKCDGMCNQFYLPIFIFIRYFFCHLSFVDKTMENTDVKEKYVERVMNGLMTEKKINCSIFTAR